MGNLLRPDSGAHLSRLSSFADLVLGVSLTSAVLGLEVVSSPLVQFVLEEHGHMHLEQALGSVPGCEEPVLSMFVAQVGHPCCPLPC